MKPFFLFPSYKTSFKIRGNTPSVIEVKVSDGMYIKKESFNLRYILNMNKNKYYYFPLRSGEFISSDKEGRLKYIFRVNSTDTDEVQQYEKLLEESGIDYDLELISTYEVKHGVYVYSILSVIYAIVFLTLFSLFVNIGLLCNVKLLEDALLVDIASSSNIIGFIALIIPLLFLKSDFQKFDLFQYSYMEYLIYFLIMVLGMVRQDRVSFLH